MTVLTHDYSVSIVARSQTQLGPPDFVELGPIIPTPGKAGRGKTGLGWGLELKGDGYITVATDPRKLPTTVGTRLRDLKNFPMEIWLWRDSVIVMRGPIIAWQVQGESLILMARGMLYYTRYMTIWNSRLYEAMDVSAIVEDMITVHQDRDWGNFGLIVDTLPATGKIVTREYTKADMANVYEEIQEMGKQAGGYDLTVDYGTGEVQLWSYLNPDPGFGLNKADTLFFDMRGIASVNMSYSLAADKFASAIVAASGEFTTDDEVINTDLRDTFGLAHAARRITNGVASNAELNSAALYELALAGVGIFEPSRDFVGIEGVSVIDDFVQGDIASFVLDAGFGTINVMHQILNINVSVHPGGVETYDLEIGEQVFDEPPPDE